MFPSTMEKIETYGLADVDSDNIDRQHLPAVTPEPPEYKEVLVTKAAIAISRAKIGGRELRLMRVSKDGKLVQFQIHKINLHPYCADVQELQPPRKRIKPVTQAEALEAFTNATEEEFPAIILRNGSKLAIHQNIL